MKRINEIILGILTVLYIKIIYDSVAYRPVGLFCILSWGFLVIEYMEAKNEKP